MALEAIVTNLDDIDKNLHELYKRSGDQYILDIAGVDNHPKVANLRSTMKKERDARKDIEKQLKDLKVKTDGLDLELLKTVDPEKYDQAIKDLEEFRKLEKERNTKKLKDKEEWEKLELQLREGHQSILDELTEKHSRETDTFKKKLLEVTETKDAEILKMQKSLEVELVDTGIVRALAEAGGNITILMPHVKKHVKSIADDEGKYAARVVDANGDVRINDKGEPMAISELVDEIKQKPEFQGEGLFKAKKKPGGSGSGGNKGAEEFPNNPFSKEHENLTEQGKIMRTDPAKAERMKAAAGKG